MKPFRYATAALGCAVLSALAGCASVSPSGATAGSSLARTATAVPTPVSVAGYRCPAPSPRKTPASRKLAARRQARVLLCDFAVPRGARRLDKAPSVRGGPLAGPALGQPAGDPDVVLKDEWWLVPGKPAAVLAWEARHVHSGLKRTGQGMASRSGGPYLWFDEFSPAAGPAWVDEQGLSFMVAARGKDTVLDANALVAWFPARPASENLPATARAVTISASYARGSKKKPPEPVTITAPAAVSKLVALINGLQVPPPGIVDCPADTGGGTLSLTLKFRTAPGRPPLAVATDILSGCVPFVRLTIGGKSQPGLQSVGADQILKIAGLDWKIP